MTSGLHLPSQPLTWRGHARLEKFHADDLTTPYEVIEAENLLTTAGATLALNLIFGTTGTKPGYMAVGDGTAAVTAGQTDLQGTNKYRQAFDSAPVITGNTVQCVTTFAAGVATFTWNEAGLANAGSAGVLFNRFLQSFGAKGAGVQWILTITATLT